MNLMTPDVRACGAAYNAGLRWGGQAWDLVQLDLADALGRPWESVPLRLRRELYRWWLCGRRHAAGGEPLAGSSTLVRAVRQARQADPLAEWSERAERRLTRWEAAR